MIFPSSRLLLSSLVLLLPACGGGGGGAAVAPPSQALMEVEPNDNALYADYIGELVPGDFVQIQGNILECCSDPYDGFAFYAPGPVELVMTLVEANPGADLDFCIYDPSIESMVACWETDQHPEVGVFDFAGPGELHIVIASYVGDSDYLLQIEALPLPPLMMASQAGEDVNRGPGEKAARRFRGYARERREASVQVEKPVFEEALLLPGGWIGPAMR
jgi:hypothetical protein